MSGAYCWGIEWYTSSANLETRSLTSLPRHRLLGGPIVAQELSQDSFISIITIAIPDSLRSNSFGIRFPSYEIGPGGHPFAHLCRHHLSLVNIEKILHLNDPFSQTYPFPYIL
jgi:hypothetical protein